MDMQKHDELHSNNYTEFNIKMIDRWVDDEIEWSKAISHEDYVKVQNGDWSAADIGVPVEWFLPFVNLETSRFDGAKLLGLASGGGQQMPVFAASGADCTVMDYSANQLVRE